MNAQQHKESTSALFWNERNVSLPGEALPGENCLALLTWLLQQLHLISSSWRRGSGNVA